MVTDKTGCSSVDMCMWKNSFLSHPTTCEVGGGERRSYLKLGADIGNG